MKGYGDELRGFAFNKRGCWQCGLKKKEEAAKELSSWTRGQQRIERDNQRNPGSSTSRIRRNGAFASTSKGARPAPNCPSQGMHVDPCARASVRHELLSDFGIQVLSLLCHQYTFIISHKRKDHVFRVARERVS